MGQMEANRTFFARTRDLWLTAAITMGVLALAWWLFPLPVWRNPLLYDQLQFASGILAVTFAAAELIRFRATGDRLPLILASGFAIVGAALVVPSLLFLRSSASDHNALLRDPMSWVINRTLLALLLVAALTVEKRSPAAENTAREIAVALAVIVGSASLFAVAHRHLPASFVIWPDALFPRPGNLVPAAVFLLAAVQYWRRLARSAFPSDYALGYAAAVNVACSVAASLSAKLLDAPFVVAELLQFSSYAVLLGGALLDDIELFENIRRLSVRDSLTGLFNYRRFIDAIGEEIQRSARTGRPFSLLLLDLDGLKRINDTHGHLVGSRALCRVANALLVHSRSIDTCARCGGDEFALVLPETSAPEAQDAAKRICALVSEDAEKPGLSISAGMATYPADGQEIESLILTADRALYRSKGRSAANPDPHVADADLLQHPPEETRPSERGRSPEAGADRGRKELHEEFEGASREE